MAQELVSGNLFRAAPPDKLRIPAGMPVIDGKRRGDTLGVMVALKTTATVDRSRTLAVLMPECGVEAGEYEVLVVLDNAGTPAQGSADDDFKTWLRRAAGSATSGLTTDAIMAATRGED